MNHNVLHFANLFSGSDKAYGTFSPDHNNQVGQKIKGSCITVPGNISEDDYERHLIGEYPSIGVIPIRSNNKTKFGAIDIDDYEISIESIDQKIRELILPLVPCKSKSGGIHLYLFLNDFIPAIEVINYLRHVVCLLGLSSKTEIFPKQSTIADKELGNFINLPYFGGDDTGRYAFYNGKKLGLNEFIKLAQELSLNSIPVIEISTPLKDQNLTINQEEDDEEDDIYTSYVSKASGRNDYLFREGANLLSRGHSINIIEKTLSEINRTATSKNHTNFADGPLEDSELKSIIKSLSKLDDKPKTNKSLMSEVEAITYMNKQHSIVMAGGKTQVITETYDSVFGRIKIERSSFADIQKFYPEKIKIGKKRTAELGHTWLKHPHSNKYRGMGLFPRNTPENYYNLWKGFAIEAEQGNCDLIKNHIRSVICSGNDEHYNYFMDWLARLIQFPEKVGEVAIVMKGGKGTGKSFIYRYLNKILGTHSLTVSSMQSLTGNFNAHLENTIFLFCDEAVWAGDKRGESILKTMITEPSIMIEPKNVNAYEAPNYLHIMIASNNDWVVPASGDERRFFILDVSNAQKGNFDYFDKLSIEMEGKGPSALLYELQSRDISNFNVRSIPVSHALQEQKIETMTEGEKWWLHCLESGGFSDSNLTWPTEIESSILRMSYQNAMEGSHKSYKGYQTALGKLIRKVCPTIEKSTHIRGMQKLTFYKLPPLSTCRQIFNEVFDIDYEWPAEINEQHVEPY